MKKILLLALFGFSVQLLLAQGFIDRKRNRIKKKIERNTRKHQVKVTVEEQNDRIVVLTRDSSTRPLDETYYFDEQNKCYKEVVKFDCDSCAQKYLNKVLSIKSYRWKKVGSSQYYSSFELKRLLTEQTDGDGSHTFTVDRINLSRKAYKQLVATGK